MARAMLPRKHEDCWRAWAVLIAAADNAEYNYAIRELTGVDIGPLANFPVDPANPADSNSGESLKR